MNRYRNMHHGASGVRRRGMRRQGAFRGFRGPATALGVGKGPCRFGQSIVCCNPAEACTMQCCGDSNGVCAGGCF